MGASICRIKNRPSKQGPDSYERGIAFEGLSSFFCCACSAASRHMERSQCRLRLVVVVARMGSHNRNRFHDSGKHISGSLYSHIVDPRDQIAL